MDSSLRSGSPTSLVLSGFASLIKKHNMYPSGHPTVDRALDLLMLYFDQYFHNRPAMVVNVGPDRLYVDGEERVGEDAVVTLSRALHNHSVAQVMFHQGIGRTELASFLRTLDVDPFEARQAGGYRKLLSLKGITSIEITEIDYRLTGGDIDAKLDALSDADVWRRLAKGWFEGNSGERQTELEFLRGLLHKTPRAATVIDAAIAHAADSEETTETATTFLDMLKAVGAELDSTDPDKATALIDDIQRLMEHVNPVTRFVIMRRSVGQKNIAVAAESSVAAILNGLRPRSLAQALFEGLHPDQSTDAEYLRTFEHFVQGEHATAILAAFANIARDYDLRHDTRYAEKVLRAENLPRDNQTIERLVEIITGKQTQQAARELPIYEYIENMYGEMNTALLEFSDNALEERSTENLLELLEITRRSETYEFYALGMDERIIMLLQTGRYPLADRAIRVLRRHASKKNDNDLSRRVARGTLLRLRRPEIAEELVHALHDWGKEDSAALSNILAALGPAAWDSLFEALTRESNRATRAILVDVLAEGGPNCAEKAQVLLHHPLWYVARNMVAVLSKLEIENLADKLEPVVRHEEPRVRKEVARALSASKEYASADLLLELVADSDLAVRHQAILGLSHFSEHAQAAEALVKQLAAKPPFGGDEQAEALAIKALGGIRVKVAIPTLGHYINGGGLLSRPSETLVAAAAEALSHFEGPEAVQALVRGSKSWNKSVRQICHDYLQRRQAD